MVGQDTNAQRGDLLELCSHLYLDLSADSAEPAMLPFMAPPPGAPPYYGFGVLDSDIQGLSFGLISDFFNDPTASDQGDGFVVAPDGARAGIVWKLDKLYVFRMVEDANNRWGVWLAGIDEPLIDRESAERVFNDRVWITLDATANSGRLPPKRCRIGT